MKLELCVFLVRFSSCLQFLYVLYNFLLLVGYFIKQFFCGDIDVIKKKQKKFIRNLKARGGLYSKMSADLSFEIFNFFFVVA